QHTSVTIDRCPFEFPLAQHRVRTPEIRSRHGVLHRSAIEQQRDAPAIRTNFAAVLHDGRQLLISFRTVEKRLLETRSGMAEDLCNRDACLWKFAAVFSNRIIEIQ